MRTLGDTPRKAPIAPKQEEAKPQQKLPVESPQTDDVFDESVVIE